MFLKSLTISNKSKVIREIPFKKGINLIVDETRDSGTQSTGNSVGKTTVLKLIDFCLGAEAKGIYLDPESRKNEYLLVKDFLKENGILITLILKEDLDDENSNEIIIERNFLRGKEAKRDINGKNIKDEEFEHRLSELIFPNHIVDKPTFRQIISHNIRYKDDSISNTLKTLNAYTTDIEYETLYLFLFGCEFNHGSIKQNIAADLKQEETFKKRLEKSQTKTAYETALSLINDEIDVLKSRKAKFNLNENFETDLENLNNVKYEINKASSQISTLKIRRDLIIEAEEDLKSDFSNIDFQQLQVIYQQATSQINSIQKTFEDMVNYHNQMIEEKVRFITKELPNLNYRIQTEKNVLKNLLSEENRLSKAISKSDSFQELEIINLELFEKFRRKGEFENIIERLNEVEKEIKKLNTQLSEIDDELFSDTFEQTIKNQISKFNKYFASISTTLYGEQYALKPDKVTNKQGQKLYKFSAFNTNFSSGKKQGEISCFDIAYTLFADEEGIPCLHFLLNDKKELMHDNQLVKIAELVNKNGIQFVASILRDKLPEELNNEDYFAVKLSPDDKLFRIENQ
jgi:uncharacterized protein YydD (DUF2326 family)